MTVQMQRLVTARNTPRGDFVVGEAALETRNGRRRTGALTSSCCESFHEKISQITINWWTPDEDGQQRVVNSTPEYDFSASLMKSDTCHLCGRTVGNRACDSNY